MKHLPNKIPERKSLSPKSLKAKTTLVPAVMLVLFYQTNTLLIWLLIAVIIGIIFIFVLITFILLPLSRRPRKKDAAQPQPETIPSPSTANTEVSVPSSAAIAATEVSASPLARPKDADTVTQASIPVMQPVANAVTLPLSNQRPKGIKWTIAGLTDVGLKRELNEDNFMMIEDKMSEFGPYGLYVVADGLGGHEAGEVASALTVDAVKQQHMQNPPTAAAAPYEEWLKDAVLAANESVSSHQKSHTDTQKMGSTLVMSLLVGQNAHIANVGDSRAYHLNSQEINQISVDHSLVERLVQIGQIDREEARTHKQRNVIYSIIGEKQKLEVGYFHVALAPGDRLLLCSDGLCGMITDEQILRISQAQPIAADACQALVRAAKEAGGHDNITAILVQMNQS